MADLFQGPWSTFDIIVAAVIVVSAVMSLGRGLIREAFSVIAFFVGFLAAYYGVRLFEPALSSVLPEGWPDITAAVILVVVGFLLAYGLAAFLGGRLSKLINASPEIGLLDRIAGAAFGVLRGALAIVVFILLMQQVLPEDATPAFIANSRFFPYADAAADWIRETLPGFVERARETIEAPVSGQPT